MYKFNTNVLTNALFPNVKTIKTDKLRSNRHNSQKFLQKRTFQMGKTRSSRSPSRKKSSHRRSTSRSRSKHSKRNRHRSVDRKSSKYRRSDSSSDSSASRYKSSSSKQHSKRHRKHDSRSPSYHRRRHRRSSSSSTSDSSNSRSSSRSSSAGRLHKNKPSSSYVEKIRAMRTPTPPKITLTTNLDFLDRKATTDAIDEINSDKFVQKSFMPAVDAKLNKDSVILRIKGEPKINKPDADDDPLFHKNVR